MDDHPTAAKTAWYNGQPNVAIIRQRSQPHKAIHARLMINPAPIRNNGQCREIWRKVDRCGWAHYATRLGDLRNTSLVDNRRPLLT